MSERLGIVLLVLFMCASFPKETTDALMNFLLN
jgi:hypothetical protein